MEQRNNNRPNIVIIDKTNKATYLIDVTVSETENIKRKQTEELEKYFALTEEVKTIWNQRQVRMIPIIGAIDKMPTKLFEASLRMR